MNRDYVEQYQYMCDLKRTLDATVRELSIQIPALPLLEGHS